MKNKFMIGTMMFGLLISGSNVFANEAKTATVEFNGIDTVEVGETFTIKMDVKDVLNTYDGVVSLGGNLSFDNTKVEYISSKEVDAPYQFQINEEANYILAGLDFTLDNGIKENVTVYEFTFKALEEGNAKITLNNYKLTDSQSYIETTVVEKNIEITNKEEINENVVVLNEVKVNENIKEEVKTVEVKEIKEEKVENIEVIKEKEETKEEIAKETKEESKKESVIKTITKAITSILNSFKKLFK